MCNPSGQPWSRGRGPNAASWKPDMPPSYDALFPHGPPEGAANVPFQIHSPQFALETGVSTLGPGNSLHSSAAGDGSRIIPLQLTNDGAAGPAVLSGYGTNTIPSTLRRARMAAFEASSQSTQLIGLESVASTSSNIPTHNENNQILSCSQSLDRRVAIRRECSTSSPLSYGVHINSPIIDPSRLAISSDLPSSPPSYDSENYTSMNQRSCIHARNIDLNPIIRISNLFNSQEGNIAGPYENQYLRSCAPQNGFQGGILMGSSEQPRQLRVDCQYPTQEPFTSAIAHNGAQ